MHREVSASELLDAVENAYDILDRADRITHGTGDALAIEDYEEIRAVFHTLTAAKWFARKHLRD